MFATILHEMIHAIGFYHEHQRFDRDNYVTVTCAGGNYDRFSHFASGPYDLNSIMHYSGECITAKVTAPLLLNERCREAGYLAIGNWCLSDLDIAGIRRYYYVPPPPPALSPAVIASIVSMVLGQTAHSTVPMSVNQHGLTGNWFQTTTGGQGLQLEVYEDLTSPGVGFIQAAWFTFDHVASGGPERQRWYTFGGPVSATKSPVELTLYRNRGGKFDGPPATSAEVVGSVTLSFSDCENGSLTYSFSDGSNRTGAMAITRLLKNVECSPSGNATVPASRDFAYSGNWFDAVAGGQGFVIELNPLQPYAFVAWFTYAPAPTGESSGLADQRWYTAQGAYTPGTRSATLKLYEVTGGLFNAPSPPVNFVEVGTATLSFADCARASFSYSFTGGSSAGRSRTIDLVRVGPTPKACA
jgi:hypothetical protein